MAYSHPSSFALHDWDADLVAPAANTANLVPGATGVFTYSLWNFDDQCFGRVDYGQTVTLDHYFATYFPGV